MTRHRGERHGREEAGGLSDRSRLGTALALLLALAPTAAHAGTARIQTRASAAASTIPSYQLIAASDPNPARLISTAPRFLERRAGGKTCCTADTLLAHTWPKLQIGIQLRAVDWAHPHFAPTVVATGPETEPGKPCTLFVAHGQPGDVFVHRWTNPGGNACWGGSGVDSLPTWKPLEAW